MGEGINNTKDCHQTGLQNVPGPVSGTVAFRVAMSCN